MKRDQGGSHQDARPRRLSRLIAPLVDQAGSKGSSQPKPGATIDPFQRFRGEIRHFRRFSFISRFRSEPNIDERQRERRDNSVMYPRTDLQHHRQRRQTPSLRFDVSPAFPFQRLLALDFSPANRKSRPTVRLSDCRGEKSGEIEGIPLSRSSPLLTPRESHSNRGPPRLEIR